MRTVDYRAHASRHVDAARRLDSAAEVLERERVRRETHARQELESAQKESERIEAMREAAGQHYKLARCYGDMALAQEDPEDWGD